MSIEPEIVTISEFQTAEQLFDFLLSEFMFTYCLGRIMLLTNDDLRILSDTLQNFMNSSARSKNQTETENYKTC